MKPSIPGLLSQRTLAAVAAIAITATLVACSVSRQAPVKDMYLLESTLPAMAAAPKPVSVRVGIVNVATPFRGRAFVYRETDLKYDADFYHEFFVAPAAMLSDATARALAAAKVFRSVVPPGVAADEGDYVVDGFVSELYGDARDTAKPAAILNAAFYVSVANAPLPSVVWSREYRQRVPVSDASADALARGWNAALSTILADLARDLAATDLPKP
jgi:cholesterol transport system auxiliary component